MKRNRQSRRQRALWALFATLLLLPAGLPAQISPGKLSSPHAELEGISNCTQCHKLGEAVVDEKCLACHSSLARRIEQRRGYHSSAEVQGRGSCALCHSEHHGREVELIHWGEGGRKSFDHAQGSGFALAGAHDELACRQCHQPRFHRMEGLAADESVNLDSTFLGLDRSCLACHEDEHREQLRDDCLACHVMEGWTPTPGFDHNRAAFALTGRHQDVRCESCHPMRSQPPAAEQRIVFAEHPQRGALYQGLSYGDCAACHKDVHKGRFAGSCSRCHSTAGWERRADADGFDHGATGYPLEGRHATLQCDQCHSGGVMTEPLAHERCADCHSDNHRGQFRDREQGAHCEQCHTVSGFLPARYTLAEHQRSDYPLTGAHLAVPCNLCHVQVQDEAGDYYARFDFASTGCDGCHRDVHRGQLDTWVESEGCGWCHSTLGWHEVSFDHSLARFPLEGRHRSIGCLECHDLRMQQGEQVVWIKPLERSCSGCHEDRHGGQFLRQGEQATHCDRCHEPTGWDKLEFDHDRDARFALDGAHRRLACRECHPVETGVDGSEQVRYKPLGAACADCHAADPGPLSKGRKP